MLNVIFVAENLTSDAWNFASGKWLR
jgi:hypothetical protein